MYRAVETGCDGCSALRRREFARDSRFSHDDPKNRPIRTNR